MSSPSPSKVTFLLLAVAVCTLVAVPVFADSQARIVRLSDVQGSVQIDKNTGLGFEEAFVNLPITEGVQVRTGDRGRAEVEFEDGSSMRLVPNTTVQFSKLVLSDSGKRVSEINLAQGMAYVNWLGKDDLALNFSHEKIALDRPAHFRVDASSQIANLAVFKGDVGVEGPNGQLVVEKKKTATFDVAENDKSSIEKNIAEAPLDSWDKEAISYHDQYAKNNNSSPYGYGVSDLNYYGSYSSVPGYGLMWQPYFTGAGWDPFMNGAWGYYPGYGYMFASAYPWGWMPYRYGNWMFVPGFGWMWQPGMWNGWVAVPRYTATTLTRVTPLTPPATGTVKTVTVGARGGARSPVMASRMTVSAGSAGLGIPRGSVSNLNHLNRQVVKTGSAELRPAPQFAATAPARAAAASNPSYPTGSSPSRSSSQGYSPSRSSMPSAPARAPSGGHSSGGGGVPHK